MKNVLITGISGYLGTRLVQELSSRSDVEKIIGVDIAPPKFSDPKVDFHKMDIRDKALAQLMKDNKVDTIYHLAFVVVPIRDLDKMHSIDFHGTRNVLECCVKAGVEHFIVTTSTLGYGAHADNPKVLTEDSTLRGNGSFPYGHNKAIVDEMIQIFGEGHPELKITILRPCTVFGPTVDNYVSRALLMPIVVSFWGCDPEFQFVHEDDVVAACILAAERSPGGAFNITGDGILKVSEIRKMVGNMAIPVPAFPFYFVYEIGWQLYIPLIEANYGFLDYTRFPFVASNEKAKAELGFVPQYDTKETLQITIDANRKRRHG